MPAADKTPTINRVIELKMLPQEGEPLTTAYMNLFHSTRKLFNELPAWGGGKVLRGGEGVVDLIPELQQLYLERTDRSLPFEQFRLLTQALYVAFTQVVLVKALNPVVTPSLDKDTLAGEDFIAIESLLAMVQDPVGKVDVRYYLIKNDSNGNNHLLYKITNTLRGMGFLGGVFGEDKLTPSERVALLENVSRAIRSWADRDKAARESYAAEEANIRSLGEGVAAEKLQALFDLVDTWVANDWVHHCDERVVSYMGDCLIPAFANGEIPMEGFYLKNGKSRPFSLHHDFVVGLFNSGLWRDGWILTQCGLIEACLDHAKHQDGARYPYIGSESYHRVQMFLGNNYTSYALTAEGTDLKEEVTCNGRNFTKGVAVSRLHLTVSRNKTTHKFSVLHQMVHHGGKLKPGSYFKDLSVWQGAGKADKHGKVSAECATYLRWMRKGAPVGGTLLEPAIVRKADGFFLRLNLTIPTPGSETSFALRAHLNSSYLHAQTRNVTDAVRSTPHRILGVDLGVRNAYAYTVLESCIADGFGGEKVIAQGKDPRLDNETHRLHRQVLDDVSSCLWVWRSIGRIRGGNCPDFSGLDGFVQRAKTELAKHTNVGPSKQTAFQAFITDPDPLATFVQQVVGTEDAESLRLKQDFIGRTLAHYVSYCFGSLTETRRMHLKGAPVETKCAYDLTYLEVVDRMKRLRRCMTTLGLPPVKFGEGIETVELNRKLQNVRDNFLKQMASRLVSVAVEHGCRVIVLEALEGYSKGINSKAENRLTALWSPKSMRAAIENAAEWHGIYVTDVNEEHTSQIHFESGEFGYRPTHDDVMDARKQGISLTSAHLYYEDGGKVKTVDADVNASANIALRAVRHHTDMRKVYRKSLERMVGGGSSSKDAGESKRLQGLLSYHYGTAKQGAKALLAICKDSNAFYHSPRRGWVTASEHARHRNALRGRVLASIQLG